jgi:spore maturation protein CgeB
MRVWAPRNEVPANSTIQKGYVGTVWGREMYQVLRDSEITINHHGDILPWANNLRLFEATGVGTFLITDWRSNLSTLFEPGSEVAAYRDENEAKEMIEHFLERREERGRMAERAHQRTLREHTYDQRMAEVVELVRRRI